MVVTDEMVEKAMAILFPLNAAFNKGSHESLKAKTRNALDAAIALMRGQSERVLIAHAVASDLAALHAVPALSRTMMTIRCSADPVADRKVPIYVFPPEKPKDKADEQ